MKRKRRTIHYSVISLLATAAFSIGVIAAQLFGIAIDIHYL